MKNRSCDALIIGAGAAGMMCALTAGQRGKKVILLEHQDKPGKKIRISGGGRCNFTHLFNSPENFLSQNPHFCKSALARFTPQHFLELVEKHHIAWHEKSAGQLFCDDSAQQIVDLLRAEMDRGGVELMLNQTIKIVSHANGVFSVECETGVFQSQALVVACGGLSIPKMGATGLGYDIARQFGHKNVPTRAGLVPFTMPPQWLKSWSRLSGVSFAASVVCNNAGFKDKVLFTHRGLSGPAILQISNYWQPGDVLVMDILGDSNLPDPQSDKTASNALGEQLPRRFAKTWCEMESFDIPLKQMDTKTRARFEERLRKWPVTPGGTEGYRTAEVTLGGVDTTELSSKTMESNLQQGLFFIGEVVDVTGHLGGHNFQWAWASGHACGEAL